MPPQPRTPDPRLSPPSAARPDAALPRSAPASSTLAHAAILALIVGVALFAHRETLDYAMFEVDSYPQIASSRIRGLADFVGTFTEELMDGRFWGVHFYRPTQNLSLALDYALWGVTTRGYHASSLAVYAACVALLYFVTRRLLGPAAWVGPPLAALLAAWHPCVINILPAPARRSELLVPLFLLAALAVLPIGDERRPRLRFILSALLVLLASGAKEVGMMGAGLVLLHQLLFTYDGDARRTAWRAARAAWPSFAAAALYMLNRTLVLGGMGGYVGVDISPWTQKQNDLLTATLCPWSMLGGWESHQLGLIALGVILMLALAAAIAGARSPQPGARRAAKLVVLGAAWLVPSTAVLYFAATLFPWYAFIPLIGVALLLAGAAQGLFIVCRRATMARFAAVPAAAGVALVATLALWATPLRIDYYEWRQATAIMNGMLGVILQRLQAAPPGGTTEATVALVYWGRVPTHRPQIRNVAMLASRTVDAWLELAHPELHARAVAFNLRDELPRKDASERRVLLRFAKNANWRTYEELMKGTNAAAGAADD